MNSTTTPENYNSQYYDLHKDKISDRRKQKYADDEEYREKAISRAKDYYKKNRDKIRKKNRKKTVVLWDDGHTEAALQIAGPTFGIHQERLVDNVRRAPTLAGS